MSNLQETQNRSRHLNQGPVSKSSDHNTNLKNTFKVMKNKMNLWLASVAFAAIIFTSSCSKEQTQVSTAPSIAAELSIPEIDQMLVQADEAFINAEITGGTETEDFAVSNDGIPDQYMVSASTADEMIAGKRDGNARRLRACLKDLELSGEQIAKMRILFGNYEDCNKYIISRHRNAMKELTVKMNDKLKLLVKAYRDGRISKEVFEAKVKSLREEFNTLRKTLAEKSRAALKECYTRLLRGLNQIMTERQWKAFVNCYKL